MKKVIVSTLLLFLSLGVIVYASFFVMFSGGLRGVWYNITNPSFDPSSTKVIDRRNAAQGSIVSDFDFIDVFPNATKYGVHNIDICVEKDYGWKRPISITSSLYICTLISQRYYGLDGEYESTVRSLISHFKLNNKGLAPQEYQTEQLFAPKDWLSDGPTVQGLIKNHNFRYPDNQVSDVREILSFLDAKNGTTVRTSTSSGGRYGVVLDFVDEGVKPYGTNNSDLYKESDEPDLRDQYTSQIIENHRYGVVVTIKNEYFQK